MSRIWGLTDGAPDTAPRGRRRRRNAREPRTSLAGQLLRLGLAVAIVSVGLGIWNLRVQEVSLRGARLSDRQAARSTAASLLDQRWVSADLDGVGKRLERLPWVREAHLRRALFSRVEVELVEHTPLFAAVDEDGRTRVLSRSGELLDLPAGLDAGALVSLRGHRLEGGALVDEDDRRLDMLVEALEEQPWPFDRPWTGVDLHGRGGLTLHLEGDSEIWLGQEDFEDRLRRLRVSHAQWRDRLPGRIDLRFDRQIVVARNPAPSGGS